MAGPRAIRLAVPARRQAAPSTRLPSPSRRKCAAERLAPCSKSNSEEDRHECQPTRQTIAGGNAVGTETQTVAQSGVVESGRAARTVDNAFPKHQVEQVLIQSNSATASDPAFRAVVGDV